MGLFTSSASIHWRAALIASVLGTLLSLPAPIDGDACESVCDCHAIDEEYIVHCARRSLTSIPADVPPDTTFLDMSYNNVTTIAAVHLSLPRLRRLDLRGSNVEEIADGVFRQWPRLKEIDLDHNRVSLLQPRAFAGLRNLSVLTLDHNALREVRDFAFEGVRTERLNLQHNAELTHIADAAFWNSSINTLILDGCKLRTVSSMALGSLKRDLKVFMLSNNAGNLTLAADAFAGHDMDQLHLSGDGLTSIEFLKASTLAVREVVLKNNFLADFDLSVYHGLSRTETLDLKNCSLTKLLRSSHLVTVADLRGLDLSYNLITTLNATVFWGLDKLTRLYLQFNRFTTIPESMLPLLMGLEYVELAGVPLECDCRLEWLREFVRDFNGTVVVGANCYYPHVEAMAVSAQAYTCSPPTDPHFTFTQSAGAAMGIECVATGNPRPDVTWSVASSSKSGEMVVSDGGYTAAPPGNSRPYDDVCHLLQCTAINVAGNATAVLYTGTCGQLLSQAATPIRASPANANSAALATGLCLAVLVVILLAAFSTLLVRYRARLPNKCARRPSCRLTVARCAAGSEVNLLPNELDGSSGSVSHAHDDPRHMWN